MGNKLFRRVASGMVAVGLGGILAQAAAPTSPQGVITAKVFQDIGGGTTVADLTGNAKFPNRPDLVTYPPYFELWATGDIATPPGNDGDNYGSQIVGYFYPPSTGDYIFYIASDDNSALYLSTDGTAANKKLIAQETVWSNPREYTTSGGSSDLTAKDSSQFTGTQWPTKDTVLGGAKITLTKGQAYYIEALQKEGGGGDNLSVAVQDPGFAIDASAPIPGQYLSSYDKNSGPVSITTQPVSVTVDEGQPASFSVVVDGTPPYSYDWMINGASQPDGTNSTYTLARAYRTDNGAKFKVTVTGAQGTVTSSEATLTVNNDTTPPTLVSVTASATFDTLAVKFSEPVDPASAQTAANYQITPGITVSAAALNPAADDTVVLSTSKQTAGTTLTLTVNGVKDVPGNTIAANSTLTFKTFVLGNGFASYQRWDGDTTDINTFVQAILDGTKEPPTVNTTVSQFGGPWGVADNYNSRVFGWFIPPKTGNYVFFVASDDQSNLYLSTDDNPANKKLIAQEGGWSNQYQWLTPGSGDATTKRSDQFASGEWPGWNPITLTANKKYYLEILHHEGGGGDGSDATYIMEGDPDPTQDAAGMHLKGGVISTYLDPNGASVTFVQQPKDTTQEEGKTATFSVIASGTSAYGTNVTYQWQKAAPGTSTYAAIAGATAASYTTPLLTLADNGTKYQVVCSVPTLDQPSAEATLSVIADVKPPTIAKVKATSVGTVVVQFDETLDTASANTAGNYALSGNVTVSKAQASGNSVLLTVSGLTVKQSYELTVGGVKDLYNNAVPAGTKFSFVANVVTYADVILADGPIGFYRFQETTGQKTQNYGTAGSSADGLYMTGNGPDDSVSTDASVDAGPRPPDFLGFDPNNNGVVMDGLNTMLWIDTQKQFLNNLKAFSLEYWVKPANRVTDPTAFGTRIGLVGQNDAVEYGFIDQNNIQIWSSGGGSLNTVYTFPDNEWHHVATIADGKTIKTYYDGVLIGTGGATTSNYGSSTYNVHIGGGGVYDATGNFFTGQFDEVAIFDKAIPAERILAHYKAGKEGGEAPFSANIAWVSFHPADGTPATDAATAGMTEASDAGYTKLLEANGHKVTRFVTTGTPDVATLNTFDLVIISRSVPSGDYQDPPETLAWNGITAPTMVLGGYIVRNSRLGYFTGGTIPDTAGPVKLSVKDPTHPIFAGVSLATDGTTVNNFADIVTWNGAVQRGISVVTDPIAGNGKVLATLSADGDPANGGTVIAEWQAGAHLATAAADVLGGHRLEFLTGSREANGSTSQIAGIYDLTDDGAWMFLNAVKYMATPVTAAPKITGITLANGQITVTWTGGGTLQTAPVVTGPWTDVAGVTSPYTFAPTGNLVFGRIKQ